MNVLNLLGNSPLSDLAKQAGSQVTNAVYNAAQNTGVDFSYLLQQAKVESSFDTDAQAKTSSARGLYQFLNRTWLDMVDRHGEKYGINTNQSKQDLLSLRDDPELSSAMAAEFASENQQFLENAWGGDIGSTELYLAHFMGAGGAASFLKARDENPLQPAAELFERAANANKNIFFDRNTGRAKTMEEVYQNFAKKFAVADDKSIQKSVIENAPYERNSTVPLHTFKESIALRQRTEELNNQAALNIFSTLSIPAHNRMFQMNTLDFVSLFKTI
jgi:hypothetical protein